MRPRALLIIAYLRYAARRAAARYDARPRTYPYRDTVAVDVARDRCCGLGGESLPWPSWPPPSQLQAPAGRAASNTTLTTSRRSTSMSLLHRRQRAAPFALAGQIVRLAPSAPHRSAQPRVSATSSQTARKGMRSGTTMSQLVFLGRVALHHRHRQGLHRHRHCHQPRSRPQFL